jgi:two-component system CheB/CheR fusion protein
MSEESTPRHDDDDGQPDRLAQPVDAEQPPRLPFPIVGVGASAGGLEAFTDFLDAMRPDAGMAFVLVQHLPPDRETLMVEILARRTAMPVRQVEDGMAVEPDHVYVIRPGHILTIRDGRLRLGPPLGSSRAANRPIDDFFRSLAEEQRERAICVVLSGMGSNGAAGAQAVKAVGGLCVAQDPETAQFPSMPRHLIDAGYADYILRPADLPDVLLTYAGSPYASGGRESDAEAVLQREQQHLREILAVLRTRTRQDFSGYKKPTLLRRLQRRMGLTRASNLADYARHLRQSPSEVTALADDLMIHVTGFFRDPDAWEALREQVIVPLVEGREPGGPVRAWVSACSSGEEAYSLAMTLVEESDRTGKRLDIKVFATDLADRALTHARAGVYPGGIESEVSPDRLHQFFAKEDEVYRIRQDLRDRVVFAPQNILQDPPFSKLDVATCRNLLIYLEPEVQHRVLALLHFGLREGGALFLGSSETVAGAEEFFEPIDKKARLFRRIGPTRHGAVEFPLSRALLADDGADGVATTQPRRPDAWRPAVAELTRQTLLESHTPAAVTVDRDHQILYYHGDTRPFLQQTSGEPTRDLMLLARDGVRGAVRIALHQAASRNTKAVVSDGWVDLEPDRRVRVTVAASPVVDRVSDRSGPPPYYVVSFEERGEILPPAPADAAENGRTAEEDRRLRGELQSTIEELQTSNEELKASNEEVMSINEELQSSNEELETSKEEMQSLNEELRTLNAQLRAKMEEHLGASSDLTSLLSSTDIAVLFLDPSFRIRRYTPAIRDLMDLIATDVGRPLAALARQFDDPHLNEDTRAVLDRLVPIGREVSGGNGRHYLRRVLPYRTADNRIDGVVITFVDITDRKRAEESVRASEERLQLIVASATDYAIFTLDDDRTVTSWSPGAAATFGYTDGEMIGRPADLLFAPEDQQRGVPEAEAADARRDGRASDERWHVRRDGTRFYASGVLTPLGTSGVGGFVKVLRDLTDRKGLEDELRRAHDEMEARVAERTAQLQSSLQRTLQAERLAAIGQTVTTLTHEGRNALQRAVSCLALMQPRLKGRPEELDLVTRTQRALDDLQRLFDDIRSFAAPIQLDRKDCDLRAVWREMWDQVIGERPERKARLEEEPGGPDTGCEADPFRMGHVFSNLFTNALEACPDPVQVRISCQEVPLRDRPVLRIVLEDNGPGFTPEQRQHALEPFYTTKYKGTGLGLAIVQRFLEAHGGRIEVEESAGCGAKIVLTLPRRQRDTE